MCATVLFESSAHANANCLAFLTDGQWLTAEEVHSRARRSLLPNWRNRIFAKQKVSAAICGARIADVNKRWLCNGPLCKQPVSSKQRVVSSEPVSQWECAWLSCPSKRSCGRCRTAFPVWFFLFLPCDPLANYWPLQRIRPLHRGKCIQTISVENQYFLNLIQTFKELVLFDPKVRQCIEINAKYTSLIVN